MNTSFDKFNTLSNRFIATEQEESAEGCRSENRCSSINIDDEQGSCYPSYFVPRDTDVIVGKGMNCYNHIGNKNLRRIAASRIVDYASTICKKDKSSVVSSILEQIHKKGGAFIKKDQETGLWYDAENYLARDKISQTFRNALNQSNSKRHRKQFKQFRINQVVNASNENVDYAIIQPVTLDFNSSSDNELHDLLLKYAASIPDEIIRSDQHPLEPNPIRRSMNNR